MELKKVAKELGENLSEDELNHMFFKADLDDDGFVTGDDFYNIMTHKAYWDQWQWSALHYYESFIISNPQIQNPPPPLRLSAILIRWTSCYLRIED